MYLYILHVTAEVSFIIKMQDIGQIGFYSGLRITLLNIFLPVCKVEGTWPKDIRCRKSKQHNINQGLYYILCDENKSIPNKPPDIDSYKKLKKGQYMLKTEG